METAGAKPKILVCLSGSVAVVKAPRLVVTLSQFAEVKVLITKASEHFLERSEAYNPGAYAAYKALEPRPPVLSDADEWGAWDVVGDPVLHIELRNWADMILIAPLSANTLAKLANGICDNLVTCVARAWDFTNPEKKFLVAPAMNTHMWVHPMTARHLSILSDIGISVVEPQCKVLACGDRGVGALAEVELIDGMVRSSLGLTPRNDL